MGQTTGSTPLGRPRCSASHMSLPPPHVHAYHMCTSTATEASCYLAPLDPDRWGRHAIKSQHPGTPATHLHHSCHAPMCPCSCLALGSHIPTCVHLMPRPVAGHPARGAAGILHQVLLGGDLGAAQCIGHSVSVMIRILRNPSFLPHGHFACRGNVLTTSSMDRPIHSSRPVPTVTWA